MDQNYGEDFAPTMSSYDSPASSFLGTTSVSDSDIDKHSVAMKFSRRFAIIFAITVVIIFGIGATLSVLYPTDSKKPWTIKVKDENGHVQEVKINTPFYDVVRPEGSPNNDIFKIIWPLLFVLLAISTSITLNQDKRDLKYYTMMFLIATQFALMYAWIPVFNKLHRPRTALYILVSLIMSGSFTAVLIAGINIYAGAIWAVLIAWLSYALNLNIASVAKYERFVDKYIQENVRPLPPAPRVSAAKESNILNSVQIDLPAL